MSPSCQIRCFFLALFISGSTSAQYKLDRAVYVGKEHGLQSTIIRAIQKGKDGFVWIATTEGLCRFDGQQTKTYKKGPDPRNSLFDNSVLSVLPVDNEIWVGTSQGISVMSTIDESFRHYQLGDSGKADSVVRRFDQSIGILYRDRSGTIWIGSRDRGVWVYDKKTDNFRRFKYAEKDYPRLTPALGSNDVVLSIEESETNDSLMWIGTTAGLERINKYTGAVKWYTFPQTDKLYQVAINAFRRMHANKNGLLYVGSWEAGVNVFDPDKNTLTPLPLKPHPGNEILDAAIGSVYEKTSGELWITSSQGLVVYNITQKQITTFRKNKPLDYIFYGVDFIDERNRIWHSNINGVQYFDPVGQQFASYSFEHLYGPDWAFVFYTIPDATGNKITVCPRRANGLYVFNKLTSEWQQFAFGGLDKMGFQQIIARGFAELTPDEYLISADEGLFVYSKQKRQLSKSFTQPRIRFNRWGEIFKAKNGTIWISADADGLVRWKYGTPNYRIYKKELEIGGASDVFGRVNNFYEDSKNNIWFSRPSGFSVYINSIDSIINFLYSRNERNSFPLIVGFGEDKKGQVWAVGADGQYGYIDVNHPENGIVRKFDLKAKGINEALESIAADREGNVWSYTSKKLIRLSDDNQDFKTFDFAYGATSTEFFHFSLLPSGEMVFGGRNGITLANPSTFERNSELPEPYITGMQVMNQPVPLSFYSEDKVKLGSRQNFFSISFSAKTFTMPEDARFRYRLSGFDDWIETNERRFVNYTNVPPGDYVFQLQVANNEGIWNQAVLELPVHIATPWWLTWWFRIGVLLAVAALAYWLYWYRIRQIRKKEKVKSQYEKKLANVEMTALLAQMNPHFLFNSLNSIDSYIIKNESGKASEYLNNFARLMRLILQNSRSNYISLKDELEALDLYLQMEALRFKDKFRYEIKIDPELDINSIVIPPMLIQPYVENAVWHGLMHKKDGIAGKVEIQIGQHDNKLVCTIQDNGIGRERAQELKAQKSGNRKRSMGMQITRDRIEMINKLYHTSNSVQIIDLKDTEGKPMGTKVELVVPV